MTKLQYVAHALSRGTNKKYETYVVNAIYQKVNNPHLEIVTQKRVKALGNNYYIDLFLPQFKMAIEVDEGQHALNDHIVHDMKREREIIQKSVADTVGNLVHFRRIKAYDVTFDELNAEIEKVVGEIKELIAECGHIEWLFGAEKIKRIKAVGVITTDDTFDTNREIINLVYDKNLKGYQRASYKELWFPVISEYDIASKKQTSRAGWINFFNTAKDIIFEKSNDPNKQADKKAASAKDKENKKTRIVFVGEKDAMGISEKRFAGVFKADGWDLYQKAERWKKISTELYIPLK